MNPSPSLMTLIDFMKSCTFCKMYVFNVDYNDGGTVPGLMITVVQLLNCVPLYMDSTSLLFLVICNVIITQTSTNPFRERKNSFNCVVFSRLQSCLTLCDPMDCSPPGSSVHGISMAKILEWVAISFSRESSQSRDWTHLFCIGSGFFITEPLGKLGINDREIIHKGSFKVVHS